MKQIICAQSHDIVNNVFTIYQVEKDSKINFEDLVTMFNGNRVIYFGGESFNKKNYIFQDRVNDKKCLFEALVPIELLDESAFDFVDMNVCCGSFGFQTIKDAFRTVFLLLFKGSFLSHQSWQRIYNTARAEIGFARRTK